MDHHVEDLAQLSTQITHRLKELNDQHDEDIAQLSHQLINLSKTVEEHRENSASLNAPAPPPSTQEQSPVPFMARVSQIYREQHGYPSDSGFGTRFKELKKEHEDLQQQLQGKLNPE